jgi:hypothetical protein
MDQVNVNWFPLLVGSVVFAGVFLLLIYLVVSSAVRHGRTQSVRDLCPHDWSQLPGADAAGLRTFRCRLCGLVQRDAAPRPEVS